MLKAAFAEDAVVLCMFRDDCRDVDRFRFAFDFLTYPIYLYRFLIFSAFCGINYSYDIIMS